MPTLFVLSDATADTAERTVRAALIQYRGVEPDVRIFSMVRTEERIRQIMLMAQEANAMLVHTLVETEQRALLSDIADQTGLYCVDLIKPLMSGLTAYLEAEPVGRPGRRRLNEAYFKRIEAVEFSVKHDDGQLPEKLGLADIVLVGISRTSKTPLSTYLAQKGWKVANVPLVLDLNVPPELDAIDPRRVFALTIDVSPLMRIRRSRLRALNMPADTDYAQRSHIAAELSFARELFRAHPEWHVINVSQRAIEETAGIILRRLEDHDLGPRTS